MNVLIDMRLIEIRSLAAEIRSFEFVPVGRAPLPPAEPGAHIDVHLPNGIIRPYSLTVPHSTPRSYMIAVKLDPQSRGASEYLFNSIRVGQTLKVSQPRNHFELIESAAHTVLIAGGIGITPIWSMVQRLFALGHPFELHYSCRSRAEMAFLGEVERLEGVNLHFDNENSGKYLALDAIIANAPQGSHFYCCGPLPMLGAFRDATKSLPWEQVHIEYFAPREEKSLTGGFTVQLARSDQEFAIPPGKTILEVLREAGVDVSYSCEEGACGACEVKVVAGVPDHRDSVLNESERAANKTIMICCSGCKGDKIVLDM